MRISAQDVLIQGIIFLLFVILFLPALATPQGEKGVEELIRDLQDESPVVRWTAAEGLGRAKDVRAVEPLIAALRDKDEGVCREVVRALGEIGDPRAVGPLGEMLKDKDEFICINALGALEKIGGDQALELIISALNHDNPMVRMNASSTLGKMGDRKAVAPLEWVAGSDPVSYVRFAAQQALIRIRGEVRQQGDETVMVTEEGLPHPEEKGSESTAETEEAPQITTKVTTKGEEAPPQERRAVTEGKPTELIAAMKTVGERLRTEYGLVLDYMKYDIMDLLDIEARMKVRHSKDTIESLLGDLLTKEDHERNRHLFGEKQ